MKPSTGHPPMLKILSLPDEVLVSILSYIEKPQLKTIRQSCKRLANCAVSSLFTTVVISGFGIDIEVFKAIAERQDLAKCVRTLVYDVQVFDENYFDRPFMENQIYQDLKPTSIHCFADNETVCNSLFGEYLSCRYRFHPAPPDNTGLKSTGMDACANQIIAQTSRRDQTFSDILTKGLISFSGLNTIIVQGYWNKVEGFDLMKSLDGTQSRGMFFHGPLARQWHPLWLRPRMIWEKRHVDNELRPLFHSLAKVNHTIRHLDLGTSRPIYRVRQVYPHCTFFALPLEWIPPSVTSLRLEFQDYLKVYDEEYKDSFCTLIPRVPTLENLDISFQAPQPNKSKRYTQEDVVFREDISSAMMESLSESSAYPRLESITLAGLRLSSTQLLDCLKKHRVLKKLYINDIYIKKGRWVELLDGLRDNLHLDNFGLCRNKGEYERKFGEVVHKDLCKQIELYVTRQRNSPLRDLPFKNVHHS